MNAARDMVRIGCGASSWGDDVGEPRELLTRQPVDYLMMDYLAEVTLSIMRRQMDRDANKGYATDVLTVVRDVLPLLERHGTKLVTNAGGLNPVGCGKAIAAIVAEAAAIAEYGRETDDAMPDGPNP